MKLLDKLTFENAHFSKETPHTLDEILDSAEATILLAMSNRDN